LDHSVHHLVHHHVHYVQLVLFQTLLDQVVAPIATLDIIQIKWVLLLVWRVCLDHMSIATVFVACVVLVNFHPPMRPSLVQTVPQVILQVHKGRRHVRVVD
jgi:hypothetical protein